MTTTNAIDYSAILAVFGDFADEYEDQARAMLESYDMETIVHYMDDEIREDLHSEIAPCDDETFVLAYMARHAERFGEDFEIC